MLLLGEAAELSFSFAYGCLLQRMSTGTSPIYPMAFQEVAGTGGPANMVPTKKQVAREA